MCYNCINSWRDYKMKEKLNNVMFIFIIIVSLISIFYVIYNEFFMIR